MIIYIYYKYRIFFPIKRQKEYKKTTEQKLSINVLYCLTPENKLL